MFHQYGHVPAGGRFHYFVQTHPEKAHPVRERAAVLVAAAVGVGREELRDEVAVACVYFHAVESRFVRRIHRTAEVGGHLSDFVAPHGAHGGVGIEVEARRCTDRNLSGRGVVRHVAAMADLDRCGGSFAVDGFGDVAQSRDDFGSQPQLFFERQPATTDGGVGQCGHSHAAAGDAHVVVFQLFGGAVGAAHRFECRRTDRAVAQRDGT